jgi:ribosome modulation factor
VSEDYSREPVSTLAELEKLDERDVISGYYAGLHGRDEPGVEFNRDYWHGWRNGMRDKLRIPADWAMGQLAAEYVNRRKP